MKFSILSLNLMVCEDGTILRNGIKPLKPVSISGYLYVQQTMGGRKRMFAVHRLVASVYCSGYAPGLVVNHKNGVKTDNRASNLEWVTHAENLGHAKRNGLTRSGEKHQSAKLTKVMVEHVVGLFGTGMTNVAIGKIFGVHEETIRMIRRGVTWKNVSREPSGFMWMSLAADKLKDNH